MQTVYGVTMVKDEIDVIQWTLRHLMTEGLDGIIVLDNGSEDGTSDVLEDMALEMRRGDVDFHVIHDPELGYYQARKMTELAHIAQGREADWVVPFDADEIWYSTEGKLADTIRACSDAKDEPTILRARLTNYFPTSKDDDGEKVAFRRLRHHDPDFMGLPKVVCWTHDNLEIHQGNHGATLPDPAHREADSPIRVGHFPWRRFKQYVKKIRNGAAAYKATNLPEEMGAHWRKHGEILEQGGEDALWAIWDQWYFDPPVELVEDPVPFMRYA